MPNLGSRPGLGLGATIGPRFFLTGAPVPVSTTNAAGQLIAFRPLQTLQRIFPVTEKTTFNSFRLDQIIDEKQKHHLTFRFGYNPSTITAIQVESQKQSLGHHHSPRPLIQHLTAPPPPHTLPSTLPHHLSHHPPFN